METWFPGAGGRGSGESVIKGHRVSAGEDEKVPGIDCGDCCPTV